MGARSLTVPGLAAALLLGGCGTATVARSTGRTTARHTSTATSIAERVCARARAAAAAQSGRTVTLRIASRDPVDIVCRLGVGAVRLDVEAQASAQAWAQFDTTQVHQIQAYNAGSIHDPAQDPRTVAIRRGLAMWIPAERGIFATNGSGTRAGSYVTVTVQGGTARGDRALARSVTGATLAVAPRGPKPS